jgi:predicted component of type VI protein secretion system
MDVRLVVEKGQTKTRTLRLRAKETIVGRRRDAGLRIASAEVSRHHCRIVKADGYLLIEDLMSVNGTFLNGKPVKGLDVLRPGDHLRIGPVTFVVEYELTPAALERLQRQVRGKKRPEADEDYQVIEEEAEVIPDVVEDLPMAALVEDVPLEPIAEEDEDFQIPVDAEIMAEPNDEVPTWHVPGTDEVRNILSQLGNNEAPPAQEQH